MNIIIWHVVGGLIGWMASLSPFFGVSTVNQANFSIPGLLVSLQGALLLLVTINLIRRSTARGVSPARFGQIAAQVLPRP